MEQEKENFTMNRSINRIAAAAAVLILASSVSMARAGSYKDEALGRIAAIEKKVVGLAETIPQDKYTWRPGEGVRSVSELFLHIASANFRIPNFLGTKPPEGFDTKSYDGVTDKAKIVAELNKSFAHLKSAIGALSEGDADKPLKMFGQETTMRGGVLFLLEHLSEHLGQSIAYTRTNGVRPPWSGE
jgi:uncharacterized damage-inducible protein DinB